MMSQKYYSMIPKLFYIKLYPIKLAKSTFDGSITSQIWKKKTLRSTNIV